MADETHEKDPAVVADEKAKAAKEGRVAHDPVGPTADAVNRAKPNQLGDGPAPKAAKKADEEESANVVERSTGAKAVTALEQNPDLSSLQDKAPRAQNPNLADQEGTTDLVYRPGTLATGQFWTLAANDHDYVFEDGKPLAVKNEDVADILEQANENDSYTITEA